MNSADTIRAVCIMGPTAAGKTEIALDLYKTGKFELISVDSAQVYREMDIGTAKPSPEILDAVPHRLISIREPWEHYSAGLFCRDAIEAIGEIVANGKLPLLVGGTMLYFQALQNGLADLPEADPELRAQLDEQAGREGWSAMHKQLEKLDPATAARLRPTDAQRIQRALEVSLITGEPMSDLRRNTAPSLEASYLNIALLPSDRRELHARIEKRLQAMLDDGFINELRALSELPGISADTPSLRAVGYRQFWPYIVGETSLPDATEKAVVATRRLAKRQLTWLRSWPDLHVVDCLSDNASQDVRQIVDSWLGLVQLPE
ncbi:MAG: tRNA (adenosine(37)-N6)-dimethylallyltransferase MiaA [Gammaproteobacteria bacterium]|jgi:tRNA dimethylallyltransferase|nr:tRNA (adenosine(37)-N6)-dimethylallyltransferase MiaA [Gammaproteobacteria bacterium]MDP6616262.1 tRNA (adenosine(37)-N6)-dimethylallyltransferase MiaA [Gammaproteobacteria bacterium]MDP6695431.1 tRNA (adenosine(37)-N6)-dimethylallyltransferase MiaA [Gammaproteobacteria bacterium]